MAEAEAVLPTPRRFFCYKCQVEISRVNDDFTCPTCHSGFIEEVQPGASTNQQQATPNQNVPLFQFGGRLSAQPRGGDPNNEFSDFLGQILRGISGGFQQQHQRQQQGGNTGNTTGGAAGGGNGAGAGPRVTRTPAGGTHYSFVFDARGRDPNSDGRPASASTNSGQSGGGGVPQMDNPVENMLYSFLTDLMVRGGLGGPNVAGGQGQGIPLLSNFGDYVWGHEGLDAIVTQLMNQMEGAGAPPMPADKLTNLPSVTITQEQVDQKVQCSVCWDDFNFGEEVKKLDCEHVYHPDCILPWLRLHGTCPVCRKDFTGSEEGGESTGDNQPMDTSGGAQFDPFSFLRPQTQAQPTTTTRSTSTNTTQTDTSRSGSDQNQNQSSSQQSGHRGGQLDHLDFEFD